ncbi:hypothetical protein NFI96_011923, partial [Prochilodus magdalenae]
MLAKLASMLENDSHPMHETLAALGSSFSDRLLHPKCVKERYRRSNSLSSSDMLDGFQDLLMTPKPMNGTCDKGKERRVKEENEGEREEIESIKGLDKSPTPMEYGKVNDRTTPSGLMLDAVGGIVLHAFAA